MSSAKPMLSVEAPEPAAQTGVQGSSPQPVALLSEAMPTEVRGGGDREAQASSKVTWLLAALLLFAVVWLAQQLQAGRDLERQIGVLTGELATTRSTLDAHRSQLSAVHGHLGTVRASAQQLERSLAELELLAGRDPLEPR